MEARELDITETFMHSKIIIPHEKSSVKQKASLNFLRFEEEQRKVKFITK